MKNMRHEPVLMKETIDALNLKPGNNVIDCTLGDAGHSEVMLEKISPNGKLLGIDLDPEAVLRAKQFLYNFQNRVTLARDNFANLQEIITKNDFDWKFENQILDKTYEIDLNFDILLDIKVISKNDIGTIKGKQPFILNALNEGIAV